MVVPTQLAACVWTPTDRDEIGPRLPPGICCVFRLCASNARHGVKRGFREFFKAVRALADALPSGMLRENVMNVGMKTLKKKYLVAEYLPWNPIVELDLDATRLMSRCCHQRSHAFVHVPGQKYIPILLNTLAIIFQRVGNPHCSS